VTDSALEIEWVRVGERAFIAALYGPPAAADLQAGGSTRLHRGVCRRAYPLVYFPLADIVVAGDVNQLSDRDIVEMTGLTQIVCHLQYTRRNHARQDIRVQPSAVKHGPSGGVGR